MVFVWKHTGCTECAMNWQVFVCLSQKFLFCYLIEQVIRRTKKWNVKSTFFGKGGSWFLSNLNQSDFETDLRTPRHSVNSSFVRQLARLANVYYLYIGTNNPHSVSWLLYHRICFCWLTLRQVDWMSWHRFYTYVCLMPRHNVTLTFCDLHFRVKGRNFNMSSIYCSAICQRASLALLGAYP